MNYNNTTISKSDTKDFEKLYKGMIGDRCEESKGSGYGVSIIQTSFRNRKGKSVYGVLMIRVGNGIIENVTPIGCSYNEKLLKEYTIHLISKMNDVKNNLIPPPLSIIK